MSEIKPEKAAREDVPVSGIGYGFGFLLALAGVWALVYYAFFFNATVDTMDGTVSNLGLEANRIVGVVIGAAVFLFGLLLAVAQYIINIVRQATQFPIS